MTHKEISRDKDTKREREIPYYWKYGKRRKQKIERSKAPMTNFKENTHSFAPQSRRCMFVCLFVCLLFHVFQLQEKTHTMYIFIEPFLYFYFVTFFIMYLCIYSKIIVGICCCCFIWCILKSSVITITYNLFFVSCFIVLFYLI